MNFIINRDNFFKSKIITKENMYGYIFLLPSFIGTSVFCIFPFADVFIRSSKEAMTGKFVGLDNYKTVINHKAFSLAVNNTLKFTIICIPMLIILSIFIASVLLAIRDKGEFFKTSNLIPLSIPAASMVIVWRIIFADNGLINKFINNFCGENISWLNTSYAFYVLILTYIWKNCGYDIIIWIAGLKNISSSIYEAASIDGCGSLQKFIYITLPNLKPVIFTVTALSIINSFKVFKAGIMSAMVLSFLEYWNNIEQPLVFLKDKSLWPLSMYLCDIADGNIASLFVACTIMIAPAVLIFLAGEKYLEDGIESCG